jgi:hypothetical protein
VSACGSPPPGVDAEAPAGSSWLEIAPEDCAIGFSGPTLNPGDAIRYARHSSLQNLALSDAAKVHVRSELLVTGSDRRRGGEFTRQDIEASVRDSRIVTMWANLVEEPLAHTKVRHVYAMACRKGARPSDLRTPPFPDWLLNLPDDDEQACAIGVGGPTFDPRDQEPATLRDGRRALAEALESRLRQIIIDTGRSNPRVTSELETTERALARAERAEALDDEWRDDAGEGPLALKGVLYGRVCTPL